LLCFLAAIRPAGAEQKFVVFNSEENAHKNSVNPYFLT
jgi:hypothetical protein